MAKWKSHSKKAQQRFLDILDALDLPRLYYGFVDQHKGGGPPARDRREDHERDLKELAISYKYLAKERFFRHEVTADGLRWFLHFSFRTGNDASKWGAANPSTLELGLYLNAPGGDLGGTVHGLAKEVAERREATLGRDPAYPRLPYSTDDERRQASRFALDLFQRIRERVTAAGGW